jgi:CBS domain containing-hemolysin-like protein
MIWPVFLLGLFLAMFGAVAASALVSVSREQLTHAVSHQLRGGPGSLSWLAEIERELTVAAATTSLGVVILGAAAPSVFTGGGLFYLALFVVLVAVPTVLFSGYLIPRWITRRYATAVQKGVGPVFGPWARFVGLLLPARPMVTPSELRALWREGAAAGLSTDEELIMVGGIMTFSERQVREIMTPRTELVAISEDAALDEIAQVFAQSGYSRIPVYRGTVDEIVGMLHAFDLFKLKPGDPLPIRPVAVAPPSRTCGDLLLDMQRERRHLAVVLDEFGGTLGIVTFEDLLEELVGEIEDEHDIGEPRRVQRLADGSLLVDALISIYDLADQLDMELEEDLPYDTLAGLILHKLGRFPERGEKLEVDGFLLICEEVKKTAIVKVRIVLQKPEEGEEQRA